MKGAGRAWPRDYKQLFTDAFYKQSEASLGRRVLLVLVQNLGDAVRAVLSSLRPLRLGRAERPAVGRAGRADGRGGRAGRLEAQFRQVGQVSGQTFALQQTLQRILVRATHQSTVGLHIVVVLQRVFVHFDFFLGRVGAFGRAASGPSRFQFVVRRSADRAQVVQHTVVSSVGQGGGEHAQLLRKRPA